MKYWSYGKLTVWIANDSLMAWFLISAVFECTLRSDYPHMPLVWSEARVHDFFGCHVGPLLTRPYYGVGFFDKGTGNGEEFQGRWSGKRKLYETSAP